MNRERGDLRYSLSEEIATHAYFGAGTFFVHSTHKKCSQ
jgi:hypothetical protein